MRFRRDWLAPVIPVPYVPTLGPVHPGEPLPDLGTAGPGGAQPCTARL
ncbi:hypothetical protein [Streptomyces sp. NBC_00103]|nr:hypothetical protein [Streptomyces sp. NBC_00103]MCX5372662.1 hypothetical protein [Streptomyces sp. NBC_00103]